MAEFIGFRAALPYARRASAAYDDESQIRAAYPGSTVQTLTDDVQFFVCDDGATQWVAVRGTDNLENGFEDADILATLDPRLGVHLHRGFRSTAEAVYAALSPLLSPDRPLAITGHSLGGAIAVILAAWLDLDGHTVQTVVTLGQPKVTDAAGVARLRALPLVRLVHRDDPVPLLPPSTPVAEYRHFGPEVRMVDPDPAYHYLDETQAEQPDASSFWHQLGSENPGDHHVSEYVAAVQARLAVP